MKKSNKNLQEQFQKAPRLDLGKNTCSSCNKSFEIIEVPLPMPGTKDLESVYCPHCEAYNGEVFINGIAQTKK